MKRVISALLAVIVIFTGCSDTPKTLDADGFITAVTTTVDFGDELIEAGHMFADFYGVEDGDVESYTLYTSATGATASELLVVKLGDMSQSDMEQKVADRVDDLVFGFEGYRPAEMPKLEAYLLTTVGDTLVFCISPDSAQVQTILDEHIS